MPFFLSGQPKSFDKEEAMGSDLFSWILAAGIFGMLWFLYLSIREDTKHLKSVAIGRHEGHRRRDKTIANA